jgi:hypothetical protein
LGSCLTSFPNAALGTGDVAGFAGLSPVRQHCQFAIGAVDPITDHGAVVIISQPGGVVIVAA